MYERLRGDLGGVFTKRDLMIAKKTLLNFLTAMPVADVKDSHTVYIELANFH